MKLPLEVFGLILSRPRIWLKSSSEEGAEVAERGRSSFATSVARAMKVERGSVIPNVAWMRFCTSRTAFREMETAISMSAARAAVRGVLSEDVGGGAIGFGGASVILLKSRWVRLEIRTDWSEE